MINNSSVVVLLLDIPSRQSCIAKESWRYLDKFLNFEKRLQDVDNFREPCFDGFPWFRYDQGSEQRFQTFLEDPDPTWSLSSGCRFNFRSFSHLPPFRIFPLKVSVKKLIIVQPSYDFASFYLSFFIKYIHIKVKLSWI